MRVLLVVVVLLTGVDVCAQEVLRIDAGGPDGLCLKGFTQNDPDRFCMRVSKTTDPKIITKPQSVGGCTPPWRVEGDHCVAVLKVAPLR